MCNTHRNQEHARVPESSISRRGNVAIFPGIGFPVFAEVRNLLHLANLLDAATTSTVWFALDDDDVIALPTETARASTRPC